VLLVGVMQYAYVAIDAILTGQVQLWKLDSDTLMASGSLRYIKDLFVVVVSLAWMIFLPKLVLPRALKSLLNAYFIWMAIIIVVGSLAFMLFSTPIFFFAAGLRWLLLLHMSLGLFVFSFSLITMSQKQHEFIFWALLLIVFVDLYVVLLQLKATSSFYGIGFGASRLTGLFSNAGVAAFFSIAASFFSFSLNGVALKKRIIMSGICLFLALSSGTRFATISIFVILLSQLWEMAEIRGGKTKKGIKLFFIPLFLVMLIYGYQALIEQVDRGNAILQQFEKGGRISNLIETLDMFSNAGMGELLIGRGLGVGTNTAIGSMLSNGINPGEYRFNMLVDNVFLTNIFQFGVIGSIIFWFGLVKFFMFVKPKYSRIAKIRFFPIISVIGLTCIAGSPLEHYFLMTSYATALGGVYWSDYFTYKQLKLRQS
jgi:hypothetical protein